MSNCENCIRKYVCKNYPVDSLPPNIRQTIFKKLDEECKEFISNVGREKGCKYCNNAAYIVVENKMFGTSDIFYAEYCPHCGRKLGENNEMY